MLFRSAAACRELWLEADQPVAPSWHSHKVSLAARSLIKRLSQRRDMHPDCILVDNQSRPNPGHQLVLADHLALRQGKRTQDIDRTAAQWEQNAVTGQLALAQIQAEPAKADLILIRHIQPQWPQLKNN